MHYGEKKKHINQQEPLVSVITPLYNSEKFISQTIESILKQTYTHWELLVIDDASTDAGPVIVKRFADSDKRIHLHSLAQNQGAGVCRNKGVEEAKGQFIAFLDSDDLWHKDKLQMQIRQMIELDRDVSYTSYRHMDEHGNLLPKRIVALPELPYQKQLRNNYVGNLTGVYNASKLGKIYSPNIKKRQDWALWLNAIRKSRQPALGIQKDLAFYRIHQNSLSSNKWKLIPHNYRFYRKALGFSRLKSAWYMLLFFWEYFVNRPKQIERL